MKRLLTLSAIIIASASLGYAETGSGTAKVEFLSALTITQLQEADFGNIVASSTDWGGGLAGAVLVENGSVRVEGDVTHYGNVANPRFKITGTANSNVQVSIVQTIPGTGYLSRASGGGVDMLFLLMFSEGGINDNDKSFTLDVLGEVMVTIDGMGVYVNTSQATGLYTGSYSITVNYE